MDLSRILIQVNFDAETQELILIRDGVVINGQEIEVPQGISMINYRVGSNPQLIGWFAGGVPGKSDRLVQLDG